MSLSTKANLEGQAAARKFMFETSFDLDDDRDDGERRAPTFSEADLNAAREEAFAEGQQAGRAEAMQSLEHASEMALKCIGGRLEDLIAARQSHNDALACEAISVAAAVCRKAIPVMAERHALEEIEGLVGECLQLVIEEPRIVVRVPDNLVEPLKGRIDAVAAGHGFAGKVVLLGDDSLAPTDCTVVWPDGGAERDGERLWADIDAAVARRLDGTGHGAEAQETREDS